MPLQSRPPISGSGSFSTACFGGAVSRSCFDANGWLQSEGDGRSWIDFNFGIGKVQLGASAPDLVNLNATSIQTLAFDGINTLEQVSVVQEMNHQWAEGTIVKAHAHWMPTDANAGNVKWNLEYAVVVNGSVVPASTTIAVIQAAAGVAWESQLALFPDIDLAAFSIGAQFHCRWFRDPTDGDDTYGSNAAISTFGLHVLVDSFGSRQVATK